MSPCEHLMLRAADAITRNASALREAHTINGQWLLDAPDERAAMNDYIDEMTLAHQLRQCVRKAQGIPYELVRVDVQFKEHRLNIESDT